MHHGWEIALAHGTLRSKGVSERMDPMPRNGVVQELYAVEGDSCMIGRCFAQAEVEMQMDRERVVGKGGKV